MEHHRGLKQFFDGYMRSFDLLDGDSAASHYSVPSFVVKNGDINKIDEAEMSGYFSDLMTSNAEAGEHGWEIAEFDVARLAANGAIVTIRWVARRPDHSVIWDFWDTYVVGDDGDGWRILGDIVHDTL
jgi:hypothetical protein